MPFTGKLGVADSKLGNIVPGLGAEAGGTILYPSGLGIPSVEAFGKGGVVLAAVVRNTQLSLAVIFQGSSDYRNTQLSLVVIFPAADIQGTAGIPSAQAFGTGGTINQSDQTITGAAGIVSGQAFGSGGEVRLVLQILTGTAGMASDSALGSGASVTGPLIGTTGIASAEAFGDTGSGGAWISTATITGDAGISSGETFGLGTIGSISGPLVGNTGIASREAFGVPSGARGTVAGPITGTAGIASAEALGSNGNVGQLLRGSTGIPTAFQFGTPGKLLKGLSGLLGIASTEAFGGTGAVLSLDTDESNFILFIGGTIRTNYLVTNSIKVDREVNFQGLCSFELVDETGVGYIPQRGEEVVLYHYDEDLSPEKPGTNTWDRCFAGTIDSIETYKQHVQDTPRFHRVNCADFAKALSRRIVNKKYPAANYGSLETIMNDIASEFLIHEGIQYVHRGDPGVTFPDIEFAYIPLNEVLDRIAEICGWEWAVDFYKNLYVYDRPAQIVGAPFDLTEDTTGTNSFTWSNLRVMEHRGLYRNRQFIKASFSNKSRTITKVYTCETAFDALGLTQWEGLEQIPGDPSSKRAPYLTDQSLRNMVSRVVSMKLNGVAQTFYDGATGSPDSPVFNNPPASWQWNHIWSWQADFIYNMMGIPWANWPQVGDELEVVYEVAAEIPPPIMVEDTAEIAARKAIEGGSGIYDAVEEVNDISDYGLLVEYAQALLDKFGVMGYEIDFDTFRFGLHPGQELTVYLPKHNVASQLMTVESVSYQEVSKRLLQHRIRVSNQTLQRDAMAAFHRLIKRMRKPGKQSVGVVTWDLATTYPGVTNIGLVAQNGLGNAVFLRRDVTLDNVLVFFKTPPTGADVRLRIRANGTSIFPSPGYITYPASQASEMTFSQFNNGPLTLPQGTKLEIDVLQVGSDQPGRDGTVHLTGWV